MQQESQVAASPAARDEHNLLIAPFSQQGASFEPSPPEHHILPAMQNYWINRGLKSGLMLMNKHGKCRHATHCGCIFLLSLFTSCCFIRSLILSSQRVIGAHKLKSGCCRWIKGAFALFWVKARCLKILLSGDIFLYPFTLYASKKATEKLIQTDRWPGIMLWSKFWLIRFCHKIYEEDRQKNYSRSLNKRKLQHE